MEARLSSSEFDVKLTLIRMNIESSSSKLSPVIISFSVNYQNVSIIILS